jgi:hypothetical protein
VDVEGPGNGADRFPVSDQFLGRFLLIWLYFLWPSESDASRLGSQSAIGLFGFPQLHAGTPKASQNILLKWPLPHGYFAMVPVVWTGSGKNKLRAGHRLKVAPFPESKSILDVAAVL